MARWLLKGTGMGGSATRCPSGFSRFCTQAFVTSTDLLNLPRARACSLPCRPSSWPGLPNSRRPCRDGILLVPVWDPSGGWAHHVPVGHSFAYSCRCPEQNAAPILPRPSRGQLCAQRSTPSSFILPNLGILDVFSIPSPHAQIKALTIKPAMARDSELRALDRFLVGGLMCTQSS